MTGYTWLVFLIIVLALGTVGMAMAMIDTAIDSAHPWLYIWLTLVLVAFIFMWLAVWAGSMEGKPGTCLSTGFVCHASS